MSRSNSRFATVRLCRGFPAESSSVGDRLASLAFAVACLLTCASLAKAQPGAPVLYEGHDHIAIGAALLDPLPGQLLVSNLGSSGKDGVEIDLSGFSSIDVATSLDLGTLAVDDAMTAQVLAPDGSGVDTVIGRCRLHRSSSALDIDWFDALDPGVLRVFIGERLVYEGTSTVVSASVLVASSSLHFVARRDDDATAIGIRVPAGLLAFDIDGAVAIGDRVLVEQVEPCLGLPEECDTISSLALTTEGMTGLAVGDERTTALGREFSAVGGASLTPGVGGGGAPAVAINNLGSTGKDGVDVTFPPPAASTISWQPILPDNPGMPGSSVLVIAHGVAGGVLGDLGRISATDGGGSINCSAQFAPLSPSSVRVEVYLGGVLVTSLPGLATPAITVDGFDFPESGGVQHATSPTEEFGLTLSWSTARSMTIGPALAFGDELHVIAEGADTVAVVHSLELSTFGISTIVIDDVSVIERTLQVPSVTPRVDSASGHVLLSWTNPVTYSSIAVAAIDAGSVATASSFGGSTEEADIGSTTVAARELFSVFRLGEATLVAPRTLRLAGGLDHVELGAATLAAGEDGLEVTGLDGPESGGSGGDGVAVLLSSFGTLDIELAPAMTDWPLDSSLLCRSRVSVEGQLTVSGGLLLTRTTGGIECVLTDATGTPVSHTVRGRLGSLVVFESTGVTSATAVPLAVGSDVTLRHELAWDDSAHVHRVHFVGGDVEHGVTVDLGLPPVIDTLEFVADSPPLAGGVVQLDLVGQGMPSFVLKKDKEKTKPTLTSVPTYGTTPHRLVRTLGGGLPGEPTLSIENLGSQGQDGVETRVAPSTSFSMTFAPMTPNPGATNPACIVAAEGVIDGLGAAIGSVVVESVPGGVSMAADFSALDLSGSGAPTQRVEIYDGGLLITAVTALSAPTVSRAADDFPRELGLRVASGEPALECRWSSSATITLDASVFVGDEIRVFAETSQVSAVTAIDFSTDGIPDVVLIDVSRSAFDVPSIEDVVASLDAVDGDVLLSWTAPVVYGALSILVGDSALDFGSPAPTAAELDASAADEWVWLDLWFDGDRTIVPLDLAALLASGPVPFVRGDANADSSIDVGDAITVLSYIFSGGTAPSCLASADANADSSLDIGDAISLLSYIFSGGPAPAEPFPECGVVTGSALACESYGACSP